MKQRRRDFLRRIAAGSALLSMPAFLAGCGVMSPLQAGRSAPDNPFLDWFAIDEETLARVMAELTANGADIADIYIQHRHSNTLSMTEQSFGTVQSEVSQGAALRIVVDGRDGFAFTEDLTRDALLATARQAAVSASRGAADAPQVFVQHGPGDLYTVEVPWAEVGLDDKTQLIRKVDEQARRADPSVVNVSIHWADSDERLVIATLDGNLVVDQRPLTRLGVQITATRGDETQSGYAHISAREDFTWYSDERVGSLIDEAVTRTLLLFDARRPPTGDMPVILAAGTSGILLHETIGHAFEADLVRSNESPLAHSLGEKIADPAVSIIDDGGLPHQRGSLNFDDEGTGSSRTPLVEDGVLRKFLHDKTTARQFSAPLTGSGRRESYRFAPMPRMTCTFMEGGAQTRDEIVASVEQGIIAETFADGRVSIAGGDFEFRIKNGWLVNNGKIDVPVKDVIVAGNGLEMLHNISMVANDAQMDKGGWTCGKRGQQVPVSNGMPTVLVTSLAIGEADDAA